MRRNLTWRELLVMAGFLFQTLSEAEFEFTGESPGNIDFLRGLLEQSCIEYKLAGSRLTITSQPMVQQEWLTLLGSMAGKCSELLCSPDELRPEILDVPMLAVVRQLNRHHFHTRFSCSGHGLRNPVIDFEKSSACIRANRLVNRLGFPCAIARRGEGRRLELQISESRLPDLGLLLADICDTGRIEVEKVRRKRKERRLEELLMIPGASSEEKDVCKHLHGFLESVADHCLVDPTGNLLSSKCFGVGPTVLLSAHMDTRQTIDLDSALVKEGSIWRKTSGIMGADDRAGAAMIIDLLEDIQNSQFTGTIKVALTVEEETGQRGAEQIDPVFFWGVDCAISLDRRNGCDIVTGSSKQRYCGKPYGRLFERVSERLWKGDNNYMMVDGGVSDLRVWSAMGIESVNLSVGFYKEHTPEEYLNLEEWHQTHDLVIAALPVIERWVTRKRERENLTRK